MLAVILTYHSFFEFLPYQIQNLKKHIKVPFKIYVVDNSLIPTKKFDGDVEYLFCKKDTTPSDRHQTAVNQGLAAAWNSCDCFLLFDNDMIFLDDWSPPSLCQYLPQQRGALVYAWLNLLFFWKDERLRSFDFAVCYFTRERTDSGGSFSNFLRQGGKGDVILTLENRKEYFPEYIEAYEKLCSIHKVSCWYDVFSINGSKVFHFRGVSNWMKYPIGFNESKKKVILEHIVAGSLREQESGVVDV
jgi:hypothetical protein